MEALKVVTNVKVTPCMLALAFSPTGSGSSRYTCTILCHGEISRQSEPHPRRYFIFPSLFGASWGGSPCLLVLFLDMLATVSIWGHGWEMTMNAYHLFEARVTFRPFAPGAHSAVYGKWLLILLYHLWAIAKITECVNFMA